MNTLIKIIILLVTTTVIGQIKHVEPPHWWVGFENNSLQLLVNDNNISKAVPQISYPGVTLEKVHKADSPNYLFIDLTISKTTKPGKFNIVFKFKDGSKKTHSYELKERSKPATDYIGFDSSDVVYLITPDRFANGDPKNDLDLSLRETRLVAPWITPDMEVIYKELQIVWITFMTWVSRRSGQRRYLSMI